MKLCILLIITMCSAAYSLTDAEITEKFEDFKVKFNRTYADQQEEEMRKKLFVDNLQWVEEHNKKFEKGEVTFSVGINQFSDRTPEEKKAYSGVIRPPN